MNKILITGNAGSGKTTLSKRLANVLNRSDLINLDRIVWEAGWKVTSNEKKENALTLISNQDSWIVDGVSNKLLELADTVIFLDFSRAICYKRIIKRTLKYLLRSRPELPDHCPEILVIGKVLKIIWNFPRLVRPAIISHIYKNSGCKKIFHLQSENEVNNLIAKIVNEKLNSTTVS